ncbi:hypothetical protein [Pseudanabaena sp. PCC 6802]|uniref:hypothetical protein n=1 Tax=Pseudanabaena sp. PCC 6802 TaxID=118173 RepID=UPI0003476CDE|nr:hypothetical protein [Pseudanabaena sp. PCC 6802]
MPKAGSATKKIINDLPSKPREIRLSELQRLASLGFTLSQIALVIGISDRTLDNYLQKDERIRGAWESGKAIAEVKLAQLAFDTAMEGDTTMIIFLCKTQLGWRERNHDAHKIAPQVQIYVPEQMSLENWKQAIAPE